MEITPAGNSDEFLTMSMIERILNGETKLYENIIRKYDKYLYKIGRSYGYDHADTEDLMQETFVNAYFHLKDFENRSAFKTWIVKIMLHQCYHKTRKSSFRMETYLPEKTNDNLVPAFTAKPKNIENVVSNNELKENIEKAVVKIPENYRIVFTLRELNGMSVHDTALALGITESNVKVRLNRAKAMLRLELEKIYSDEEIFEFNLVYCDALVNKVMKRIEEFQRGQS